MKAKKRISLVVTLLVLAGAGYGAYRYYNKPVKLTYLKVQVSRGAVEAVISATGTLSATRLVPVGSQVSGRVVSLRADFNTQVKKGQLLAEIDPSTFESTVQQRQAALESAKTQKLQAEVAERRSDVDVRNAETNISSQKLAVSRADSQLKEAQRKYTQQKGLADQGIVSKDTVETLKATLDQAQLSLETAQASLRTAEATLESTKASREVTATQKITAASQITQAEGALKDAELNLSYTKIISPVDGVVIERKTNEGETVAASMTTPQLFSIAEDLTEMHLDTNIDESDISRVVLGQTATFNVDAFPGQTFRGEVLQIRRGAVNVQNVISYTVVISVDNSDLRLFPGMTANTRIVVDRVENTLRIPSSALRFRPPAELADKVIGDVGKGGKGKGGKDGGFKDGGDSKAPEAAKAPETTSKVEAPKNAPKADAQVDGTNGKETAVAQGDSGTGKRRGNRNGGKGGDGSFDPSQFQGKGGTGKGGDGGFDREALRAQFEAKGIDPSQFQGRGGGGTGNGGGNFGGGTGKGGGNFGGGTGKGGGNFAAGGGRSAAGGGRGARGAGGQVSQQQTVYRLTATEQLEAVRVRTGISDGNFVALLSTNLEEGAELVTAVDGLPTAAKANNQNNPPGFPGGQGFPGGGGNKGGGGIRF